MKRFSSIGEVAKASGVRVVTIRYYEQIGLMPPAARTAANYRRYGKEAKERLQFIRRCRELGFTIGQIRDLIRLSSEKTMPCGEVKRIASLHERALAAKLNDLRLLLKELHRLSTSCDGQCFIQDCGIIEALSGAPLLHKYSSDHVLPK
jgi:DNA-binding transcriptional MerR regulator